MLTLWLVLLICFEPSLQQLFTVTSGAEHCELTNDGTCVTDGSDNYGNNEACSILANAPLAISTIQMC